MSNTESRQNFINKTKNIVSATILIMSVNDDAKNANSVRERTIDTALNLLDDVSRIRTLTPVYKNQFITDIHNQIDSLLDYLHVAYSVGVVSRMNVDILAKELRSLNEFLSTATNATFLGDQGINIELPEDFFTLEDRESLLAKNKDQKTSIKDNNPVQNKMSLIKKPAQNVLNKPQKTYVSNNEKRRNRKDLIVKFITEKRIAGNTDGVMVKDMVGHIKDVSEKTLQRELSVLVAKGVLKKIGDKRWSRYVLK